MDEVSVSTFQLITHFVKDVFGTYLVEEMNWKYPDKSKPIGRTYFLDRKKAKSAINDRTLTNLLLLYKMALTGNSTYDPLQISQNFAHVVKYNFGLNIDYLILFPDDNNELRQAKIDAISHLLLFSLMDLKGQPSYDPQSYRFASSISRLKLMTIVAYYSAGTYTEVVLQNLAATDPK